jgi:hypothetical protein
VALLQRVEEHEAHYSQERPAEGPGTHNKPYLDPARMLDTWRTPSSGKHRTAACASVSTAAVGTCSGDSRCSSTAVGRVD